MRLRGRLLLQSCGGIGAHHMHIGALLRVRANKPEYTRCTERRSLGKRESRLPMRKDQEALEGSRYNL
jgi:hypothetical protein